MVTRGAAALQKKIGSRTPKWRYVFSLHTTFDLACKAKAIKGAVRSNFRNLAHIH